MKKIFSIFGWAALMAAGFTACSESDDVTTPTPEPQTTTYTVVASLDEASRVTMGDSGMAWEAGDVIAVRQVLAGAEGSQENSTLAAENIAEDGTASYTFNSLNPGALAWFIYGWNGGSPANKVEFLFPKDQTQAAAGVMNKQYLRLMSDALEVPSEGQTSVEAKMNIVGTVMRFIVYSGTGARATEKVQSVTLESVDNAISGNGAVVGKNLLQGGLYLQSNNVEDLGEECKIFYAADSKKTTVTLDEPLLLDKTDAASSEGNGIYLTVPAVSVGGYKYLVETDQALYTFDASTKSITFAENEVKSVLLNVEKATSREEVSAVADKVVTYNPTIVTSEESPKVISGQEVSDLNIGYCLLYIDGAESRNWTGPLYGGTTFKAVSVEDYNSEAWKSDDCEELDWLSCDHPRNGEGVVTDCTFMISAKANPDPAERMGVIVVCYPEVAGYVYGAEAAASAHFPIYIKQEIYSSIITLGVHNAVGNNKVDPAGETKKDLGYCYLSINGQAIESWADDKNNEQLLYKSAAINAYVDGTGVPGVAADWLKLYYGTDSEGNINTTHIFVDADPNNTTATRIVNARILFTAPEGYQFEGGATTWSHQFQITQEPNLVLAATLNNPYAETVAAAGGEITAATLALTVNGEAAADVAAAMTTYGVTATVDKGATASVAADGTVTVTIPENLYKNGGVAYTLTVKAGAETLATMTINQAEGDQEQGEDVGNVWGYTIDWNCWSPATSEMYFNKNMATTYRFLWISNVTKNGEAVTGEMSDADYAEFRSQVLRVKDGAIADDFVLVKIGPDAARYYFDCGTGDNPTGAQLRTTWQIMNADGTVNHEIDIIVNP